MAERSYAIGDRVVVVSNPVTLAMNLAGLHGKIVGPDLENENNDYLVKFDFYRTAMVDVKNLTKEVTHVAVTPRRKKAARRS